MFYEPPINYEPPVFRPPSEWRSLLIQVTIGCSNNKCTYCDMYRSKQYRVRPISEITAEIESAATYYKKVGQMPEKIFLCDGDALGAPMDILVPVLEKINEQFPNLKRVGIYATAENMLEKSEEELRKLKELKLNIAYLGLESGDDKILHMIVKGNTAAEMKEASLKIKKVGWKLSTIVMLGVGGKKYSKQHIENTAKIIGETSPHYFSFLTTFAVPGTPYHKMVERGLIEPLTSKELFFEMKEILGQANFQSNDVIFRANHVSNMLPLSGTLPFDQKGLVEAIESWWQQTPEGVYPKAPAQM